MKFLQLENGQRFRFNCMYWEKTSSHDARMFSDDVYEAGKSSFVPNAGKAHIGANRDVELVEDETKWEKDNK